jgi:hypothetical protein
MREKNLFFVGISKVIDEKNRSRIRICNQVYGSKDPDPYQNGIDLEHCCFQNIQILKLYSILYVFFD